MKITLSELKKIIREELDNSESLPLQSRIDTFLEQLVGKAVRDETVPYMDAPMIAKHWKKYASKELSRAYPDVHSWLYIMSEQDRTERIQSMMANLEIPPYV